MRFTRVLLFALLFGLPCAAEWTTAQKQWALGTSAMLTKLSGERYDLLASTDEPAGLAKIQSLLEDPWGIYSRQDLLESMQDLRSDDSTLLEIAWNYTRLVTVARWGYAVNYLTEDEAWAAILPAAVRLQHTFFSWQELGHAYMDARRVFFSDHPYQRRKSEWAYRSILVDTASPWRKYAWDLDLGGDPVTAKPAKSAELTIAVHPQGLMCVRVRVPDHLDAEDHAYDAYLTAVEKVVGCKPRVTGARYDSKDWVLDTECTNQEAVQGNQIIAQLNIEAIAAQLRREGVTEMFTYIQHEPLGTSALNPAAQDEYVDGDLQWHVNTLSLGEPLPNYTLTYGTAPENTSPYPGRVQLATPPGNFHPAVTPARSSPVRIPSHRTREDS